MTETPHVVIVGAGFAGLSAVSKLRKAGLRVTVIDKNLYSTFQPLLYQVATGGLNPGDVAYPVGGFTTGRNARYIRGELEEINQGVQAIRLAGGRPRRPDGRSRGGVERHHEAVPGGDEEQVFAAARRAHAGQVGGRAVGDPRQLDGPEPVQAGEVAAVDRRFAVVDPAVPGVESELRPRAGRNGRSAGGHRRQGQPEEGCSEPHRICVAFKPRARLAIVSMRARSSQPSRLPLAAAGGPSGIAIAPRRGRGSEAGGCTCPPGTVPKGRASPWPMPRPA